MCRVSEGVTLESVEIWPQVNDVEGGVTLEAEVMWPKVQNMEQGVTLETGHVTTGAGVGSHWRLRTCDPRCRVWEAGNPGDSTCDLGHRVW